MTGSRMSRRAIIGGGAALLLVTACGGAAPTATAVPKPTEPPKPAAAPTQAPAAAPTKPAAAAEPTKPAAAAEPTKPAAAAVATKPAAPAGAAPAQPAAPGTLIFLSGQLGPVEEQERYRNGVLKDAPVKVDFIAPQNWLDRFTAEQKAGKPTASLVGALHGDLSLFVQPGYLEDLTELTGTLRDRNFPKPFLELGKLGTGKSHYVPWMQATYVLAFNKKAQSAVPSGVDVNKITYAQLKDWGKALMAANSNRRLVGFPAGAQGLLHRFFQGYLYPSYTGSSGVVEFKSPDAIKMWDEFKELWTTVNPQSTNYGFMQEPLLAEEAWVAWDHTARLINAVKDKPNDFLLVPAPAGPKGRGFMPVLAGFAIPKGAPDRAGAEKLISWLTEPRQQVATLREVAFFPTTDAKIPDDLSPGLRLQADAVAKQASAPDALPSLLPVGLGAKNAEFNKVFLDTFQRIVVKNEPTATVLNDHARIIQAIMDETKASCWPPDPPGDGPCKVK